MSVTLEGPLEHLREREVELLGTLAGFVETLGGEDSLADARRLRESAEDLRSMFFLLVVVGEFNAGKSTLINALLGEAFLPVGATPTTETIELVRSGRPKSSEPVAQGPYMREWRHPNTGGAGVSIVDTPGTGSVFRKHEETAKSFLHRADLVLFVLSAKRAFAETERLYLELAKSYGKKVLIVINQADLLDEDERAEVKAFVKVQVKELLNLEPPLFMVSARQALQGEGQGGIEHLRNHLNRSFMDVPPAKQKLLAQLTLAERVADRAREMLRGRLRLVGEDEEQAQQVRAELEAHAEQIDAQREAALHEIARTFGNLRARGEGFIDKNLRLSKIGYALDRERLRKDFETEVSGPAVDAISAISTNYVNALIDGSRVYWRGVLDQLNRLDALVQMEVGAADAGTYADQRAVLQEAILAAEATLRTYSDPETVDVLRAHFRGNLTRLAASTTVAIGGALIFLVNAAAAAVPGGMIASSAALLLGPLAALGGGAAAALFWSKLTHDAKDKLSERLNEIEATYKRTLNDLTERERSRLLQYGQQILAPVVGQLRVMRERYQRQGETLADTLRAVERLRGEIKATS